ncbi:hypothetical protein EVAR_29582_1 [Eumeta japonica]|uniref:Uncharacterized protein n=1 Tax=Eumeta variegata TaxID=151549 RepID=A0A4C1VT49_EUMVA|nr:hypothetical protein EVAR_29582_1 [Eumeta japonica]
MSRAVGTRMCRPAALVGRDESDDKSDDFDSFTECGRTVHRMSQETVTGRFPSLLPGRRRLAAAGWSKGA